VLKSVVTLIINDLPIFKDSIFYKFKHYNSFIKCYPLIEVSCNVIFTIDDFEPFFGFIILDIESIESIYTKEFKAKPRYINEPSKFNFYKYLNALF
jgi:hypothetical protein